MGRWLIEESEFGRLELTYNDDDANTWSGQIDIHGRNVVFDLVVPTGDEPETYFPVLRGLVNELRANDTDAFTDAIAADWCGVYNGWLDLQERQGLEGGNGLSEQQFAAGLMLDSIFLDTTCDPPYSLGFATDCYWGDCGCRVDLDKAFRIRNTAAE